MDNNDYNEIDKWTKEKETEEINKYGKKLSEINIEKDGKSVNKFVKFLKIVGHTLKTTSIGIFLIIAFIICILVSMFFDNIKSRTNIGVKDAIEPRYNIKVNVIDKEIDKNENEKYFLQVKDNSKITFTAIKKFGNLAEDYSARSHKYYFEKWDSDSKKYFKIEEHIENDILSYATYIENFNDIKDATNKIIEFANYCGDKFNPAWRIFLKKDDIQIYPYQSANMTPEEAMQNSKELYQKYFN